MMKLMQKRKEKKRDWRDTMSKQLKALYETKEMLEKEYKEGIKIHYWDRFACPLCLTFNKREDNNCKGCPFNRFSKEDVGCLDFDRNFILSSMPTKTHITETLSIIISIIQYYEENK